MADNDKEINDLINKKLISDFEKIKTQYKETMESEVKTLRDNIEKDVKSKVVSYATAIVSVAVMVLVSLLHYSTKDVNDSVIGLQKDIISAQKVIRDSMEELNDSKSKLIKTTAELDAARTNLSETKKTYEKRIESLTTKKDDIHEFKWTNVTKKNQAPDSDYAIDTSQARRLSISIEPMNKITHKSKNYDLVMLEGTEEAGPYSYYYEFSNVKDSHSKSVSPPAGFMKLQLNVHDSNRADVKAVVRVIY